MCGCRPLHAVVLAVEVVAVAAALLMLAAVASASAIVAAAFYCKRIHMAQSTTGSSWQYCCVQESLDPP